VNTWKVILATMVIFAAGVLTGGMLTRQWDRARITRPAAHPGRVFSPGGSRLEFLRRAQRALDLTPEQREKVDKILKDSQERTRKLMEPVSPQLRLEIQHAREEFRQVLTPDQQERFDQLVKKPARPREHHPQNGPGRTNTNT
jgi:Spy/CpxP family protein refolding chaperone